jgi:hypothetical protein
MNKAALVAAITPLPNGYSGSIKVVNAKSHIERNVAILSYDMDETEIVFGQNMTARYHETDTWMRRHGQWQIVRVRCSATTKTRTREARSQQISRVCGNVRVGSREQADNFPG